VTVTHLRPFTLGGSVAAAAAGIDPYRARVMAWAELTGRYDRGESEAMWWGKALEPVIDAAMIERGYEILPAPAGGFTDAARSWLTGHPDGFVSLDGERAVYERKTMGQWAHRANGSGAAVPLPYQAQSQIYMHLTGCESTLVATLVGGQRLEVGTVERDDRAIAALLERMADFRGYLRRDKPPAPDGSDSARTAVIALFPEAQESKVYRLTKGEWADVRELRARKEQADVIAAQIAELESRLKLAMGDAETAISPHDTDALHWRNARSARVDVTALRAQRPEIAAEYEKVTTTRRFTLA
jgi:predicted phage-related endonuclease